MVNLNVCFGKILRSNKSNDNSHSTVCAFIGSYQKSQYYYSCKCCIISEKYWHYYKLSASLNLATVMWSQDCAKAATGLLSVVHFILFALFLFYTTRYVDIIAFLHFFWHTFYSKKKTKREMYVYYQIKCYCFSKTWC